MQPLQVDPIGSGRALQPMNSMESLGAESEGGKGKGKGKNKKQNENKEAKKKLPNFAVKANGKVKIGRTTLTDAKYWVRTIQDDQKIPDPTKRKVHLAYTVHNNNINV